MNQVTIVTRGMNCEGCESRIEKAVAQLEGVRRVNADHHGDRVEVAFDDELEQAVIEKQIEALGYEVTK